MALRRHVSTLDHLGRRIEIWDEVRKTKRGTRRVSVARIGEGFEKSDYKARPKGSIVAWKYRSSKKNDIRILSARVAEKVSLGVRKGLVGRLRSGDERFISERGKMVMVKSSIRLRKNIIEYKTSSRLKHSARVGAIFLIKFVDGSGRERLRRREGWSRRQSIAADRLSQRQIRLLLEEAGRSAVAAVCQDENIGSDAVVYAEPDSPPMYWYDVDRRSGRYKRAETTIIDREGKTRYKPRKVKIRGLYDFERERFKRRTFAIRRRGMRRAG